MNDRVLVVGAGFSGSVVARTLAEHGHKVLLIDKREHLAGNAYDYYDAQGVLVHRYGPHIFHTNSERIVRWLSRFTNWRFYEHRVLAEVDGMLYPIPVNRKTINGLYGLNLNEEETQQFLERVRIEKSPIQTSEDVVLAGVGIDLCEKFFRGYTRKQWGLDLSQLSAGVASRIPVRTNEDDRYFTDTYQLMPVDGYTRLFERMLSHPNIETQLSIDFFTLEKKDKFKHIVYTGTIDGYYDYCYGKLPYRSLAFTHEHFSQTACFQSVGTVNYPNTQDYTRITEFKHLTGQVCEGTSVVYEYPQAQGEPYYPIPRLENEALYQQYKQRAAQESKISFVGRLAQYRYYNMDQVVGAALTAAERLCGVLTCH
jgi:UDP-galactopyranose mutase